MSIRKRGKTYWYEFVFKGQRIQKSTCQSDRRVALQMEAAYKTAMAKNELHLLEKPPAPTLKGFAQRFADYISTRCAAKPKTVEFYTFKMARLLEYEPLAEARLDQIDEARIERYVQERSKQVAPATVNRQLATLRRALRMAQEWRLIDRVPRIRLLPGERTREFVLSHEQEKLYLGAAPQQLQDVALLIVDTGLRVGEALKLEWRDVHLKPANGARFGYFHVRDGKSKYARRNLSMTARVRAMLEKRQAGAKTAWVFTSEDGNRPLPVYTVDSQHSRVRALLSERAEKNGLPPMPKDFVIHSLRHTFLTRLGEAGADAFSIMRIAGHSTVVVSQRYVHPSPEALERAFERLEALNAKATGAGSLPEAGKVLPVPTNFPTLPAASERPAS